MAKQYNASANFTNLENTEFDSGLNKQIDLEVKYNDSNI